MIITAVPLKPFTYTAKNTARRQAVLQMYDAEIDELYAAVEKNTQTDLPPPSTWDLDSVTRYVKNVVQHVLNHDLGDSEDIFNHGCDRCVSPSVLMWQAFMTRGQPTDTLDSQHPPPRSQTHRGHEITV